MTHHRPFLYRKVHLENGATLVMERNENVRSVSVGVWVNVGSSAEPSSLNGISHFLEHMVFKGTARRTSLELATVIESLGGDLNAFTDREVTCFHATVLSEHLDVALDVLSDLTLHPIFPKAEIEPEKRVLLQELSMVEESPDDQVYDLCFKSVWKDQRLGQPVIGNKNTITSFSRAKALRNFERYYQPQNMVISVAGNVDIERCIDQCEKLFFKTKVSKPILKPKQKVVYHPLKRSLSKPTDQLHLVVGFEGLSMHDSQRYAALILNVYLGGGMSSRLFQEIREKAGLAYSVDCDFISFADAGLCAIYMALQPKSFKKCLSILGKELTEVSNVSISEDCLIAIKNQIKGSIILASEHTESRQESLGRNEIFFGRHLTPEEILNDVEKISCDQVREVAERIFQPKSESLFTVSRQKQKLQEASIFS